MIKDEELDMLLNTLFHLYGYDFSNYARSSLKRRANRLMVIDRFPSFAELFYRVKNDPDYLTHLVQGIYRERNRDVP